MYGRRRVRRQALQVDRYEYLLYREKKINQNSEMIYVTSVMGHVLLRRYHSKAVAFLSPFNKFHGDFEPTHPTKYPSRSLSC